MPRFFTDIHDVYQGSGQTLTAALYRHLTDPTHHHGIASLTWDGTFSDLQRIHAGLHGRLGRQHPQYDSVLTQKQKQELQARLEAEYAIAMPQWFFQHSFLSDLKAFERTVRAAYLARPSTVLQDGLDTPDQA